MLNHSGPYHFGLKMVFFLFFTIFPPTPLSKVVIIQMFTIFPPTPLSKGYGGQDPSNGM